MNDFAFTDLGNSLSNPDWIQIDGKPPGTDKYFADSKKMTLPDCLMRKRNRNYYIACTPKLVLLFKESYEDLDCCIHNDNRMVDAIKTVES